MRLLTVALGLAMLSPVCAGAQTAIAPLNASTQHPDSSLSDVAFVNRSPTVPADPVRTSAALGEAFATPAFLDEPLSGQPRASTGRVAAAGEGLIAWRSSEVSRAAGGGAVDSVRLSVQQVSRTPLTAPGAPDPQAVDVAFTRGWPDAMLVRGMGIGVNVSPHAGFGVGSAGGNRAEAGAMFKFSSIDDAVRDRLSAMGVKNGSAYGDQGRWYVFAAVKGQAVGLNMMSNATGALRQAGWSTDASSALVGDGQLGLGWRKGGIETTVGYIHRGVHVKDAPLGASDSFSEDLAAMSFTFHPRW